MDIYDEIKAERAHQEQAWGQEHDDSHTPDDWEWLVREYGTVGARTARNQRDMQTWRKRMMQAAALAVAAVEWHDRARLAAQPAVEPVP